MSKEIKDLDLVLAGRLATMVAVAGDVEIRGPMMTIPIRDLEGSLVSFDYDIRGLAATVEDVRSDAVAAMGNERGGQHAALALIANGIMEDHPDWDFSVDSTTDDNEDSDVDPVSVNIEDFSVIDPEHYPEGLPPGYETR
jgi:hypothetical protein